MRQTIILIYLCSIFAVSTGMGRRDDSPSGDSVEHSVILSGPYSMVDSFRVELVTSDREWDKIWHLANGRVEPLPSKPTVNFGNNYVIAAFMGQRSSSGYQIEIADIVRKGRTLQVRLKKYETPGMLTVITQPFTLVRIPKGNYKLEVIQEIVQ